MKKVLFYLAIIISIPFQLSAQNCFPDGIIFSNQEEIDQFPQTYPNCTIIDGAVIINGDNITNLDSLYTISRIDSTLHIFECNSLSNLSGISNLQELKQLIIENNENLSEISGFNNLTSLNSLSIFNNDNLLKIDGFMNMMNINGNLIIRNCSKMMEFNAFDKLQNIKGELEFIFNSSLEYCPKFKALTTVEDDFSFIRNSEIRNLIGFDSLSTIGGNALIHNNSNLNSLNGFNHLQIITQNLEIKSNDALLDLKGLNSLENIGGDLNIWNNDSLQSLVGLNELDSISNELVIRGNPNLHSLEALLNLQLLRGIKIIENNSLSTLMGLNNITSLGKGRLYILDNLMLNSLHGIDFIDDQTIADLRIIDNPNLFNCEVESVCNWVDYAGMYIMGNAYGCNDRREVQNACNSIGEDKHSFPMLIDHPTWNVLECDQTEPLHCSTNTYEYIKDTLLCWRIYSILDIGGKTAYIRSDGKKTYFRASKTCWKEEYLLYNFNLDIGDTVTVGWNQYLPPGGGVDRKTVLKVTDKHTINYLDKYRLRLKLRYAENEYIYWTEGIGCLTHPFYPYVDLNKESDNHFELLCMDSLWTQFYQNPNYDVCDTIVDGIVESEYSDGLIIAPNPFQNQTTIQSPQEKILHVKVYSITGKLMQDFSPDDQHSVTLTFDQDTHQGIYLLQVITDSKMIQRKILKL